MDTDKARPDQLSAWLVQKVAEIVKRPEEEMDVAATFTRLGIDSLSLLSLTGDLASWLGTDLPPSLLMEYPTIQSLTQHLAVQEQPAPAEMIPRVSRDRPLPLTFPQARVIAYAELGPEGDKNLLRLRYRLGGPLNQGALQFAFDELVRRHEILRTTFIMEDVTPLQLVHPPEGVRIETFDFSGEPEPEAEGWRLLEQPEYRRMNLREGPLLRVLLVKLGADDHRLVIVMHHVMADAVSLGILREEIGALYKSFCRGTEPALGEPELQVGDFAVWQRDRMRKDGEVYRSRLEWWLKRWGGEPLPSLALPFAWKEKPQRAPEAAECGMKHDLPGWIVDRVKILGREENATPYVTYLAVFVFLLHHLTAVTDMAVGTYVTDRTRPGARRLLGIFINMLPLRLTIRGDLTFRQLLAQTRDTFEQATFHKELPYEDLKQGLQNAGKPVPEIEVIFQYLPRAAGPLQLDGLEVSRWERGAVAGMPWGFGVTVAERDKTYITAAFDGKLYDPTHVRLALQQYEVLLEAVGAHPDRPIRLLEFQQPSETCSADASEEA